MPEQGKILILTSKTGGGHVSLSEAMRDRLATDYTIEINDPQPTFFHWHYRVVTRYALWLWAAEFRAMDTPKNSLAAHRAFTRLVSKPLNALLDRVQPDIVITTYPFLTYEVMRVLEQRSHGRSSSSLPAIPFVMILADPNGVHCSWLTEHNAAATFATSHETYEQALKMGFDPKRLHLVGMPMRGQFYRTDWPTRSEMLTKLQLKPDRFTIFLQGGGEGAARFSNTVENVLAAHGDLQIILAAGTNRTLLTRFAGRENLYALPFTKEIAPYMAAADVVMGKAGPNMLFESVTLGKPFIATTYIPGQEKGNLDFILRHGLGWVVLEPEQQRTLVEELITDSSRLNAIQTTVEAYRQWNTTANDSIVPLIHALASDGQS